jgi:hypothetical protein
MDFSLSCTPNTNNDWCIHGTCITVNNSTKTTCQCNDGYRLDNTWFHQATCTDSFIGATIHYVIFISFTFLAEIFLIKVISDLRKKSGARLIGMLALFGSVNLAISATALYVEEGCHTICAFFIMPAFILHALSAIRIAVLCFAPLTLMSHSWTRTLVPIGDQIWTIIIPPCLIITGLSMTIMAALESPTDPISTSSFNRTALANILFVWIAGSFIFLAIFLVATRLGTTIQEAATSNDNDSRRNNNSNKISKKLSKSGDQGGQTTLSDNNNYIPSNEVRRAKHLDTLTSMVRRLHAIQAASLLLLLPFFCLSVAVPVAIYYHGVLPYYSIVVYFQYQLGGPILTCCVAMFLRVTKGGGKNSSTNTTKSNNPNINRNDNSSRHSKNDSKLIISTSGGGGGMGAGTNGTNTANNTVDVLAVTNDSFRLSTTI